MVHPRKACKLQLFGIQKLLSWRTSLHAAIDRSRIPWLPPMDVRTPTTPQKGLPCAAHATTRAAARYLARARVAMVRTVPRLFRLLSILHISCHLNILQLYSNNKNTAVFFLLLFIYLVITKKTALNLNTIKIMRTKQLPRRNLWR